MASRDEKLKAGKLAVDVPLVERLIVEQFPQWCDLPIWPVATDGWDNWTFHLGDSMKVRLPSAGGYNDQTAKEAHWLPILAPHLPVAVPEPIGIGMPSQAFPWTWSVYKWIDGDPIGHDADKLDIAAGVAGFLKALQAISPTGGPAPGEHNFYRGAHFIDAYGMDARRYVEALGQQIDIQAAYGVLDLAAASRRVAPVWLHGDIAVGNLLSKNGRLSAVIDFGGAAVGDPACDLVLAWVFLDGESRRTFRSFFGGEDATWARARAWALWKAALLVLNKQTVHAAERSPMDVIRDVLSEHRGA